MDQQQPQRQLSKAASATEALEQLLLQSNNVKTKRERRKPPTATLKRSRPGQTFPYNIFEQQEGPEDHTEESIIAFPAIEWPFDNDDLEEEEDHDRNCMPPPPPKRRRGGGLSRSSQEVLDLPLFCERRGSL